MATAKLENPELAEFRALPDEAQLLLAYCLVQDNHLISLLSYDHDVDALVSKGWMQKVGTLKNGLHRYAIVESKWDLLLRFDEQILTPEMGDRLEKYRVRKRALYPWCW